MFNTTGKVVIGLPLYLSPCGTKNPSMALLAGISLSRRSICPNKRHLFSRTHSERGRSLHCFVLTTNVLKHERHNARKSRRKKEEGEDLECNTSITPKAGPENQRPKYSKTPRTEMAGGRPSARQCGQPTFNTATLDSK